MTIKKEVIKPREENKRLHKLLEKCLSQIKLQEASENLSDCLARQKQKERKFNPLGSN